MSDSAPSEGFERHRALGNVHRWSLLAALGRNPKGMDANQLAQEVGLQRNSVRFHLAHLQEEGLVWSEPEVRITRGRPRVIYHSAAVANETSPTEISYQGLASLLAQEISMSKDVEGVALRAGRRWAEALDRRHLPLAPASTAEVIEAFGDIFSELGFDPINDNDDIVLRTCPFETVAREHQDVICGLHLGTLRSLAEEMGIDPDDITLSPFVTSEPMTCTIHCAGRKEHEPTEVHL
jgi:predicted ArsR family transcriptional regulator